MTTSTSTYKEIAARKRAHRDSQFKAEWLIPEDQLPQGVADVLTWIEKSGRLSDLEIEITSTPAPEIVAKVKSQTWTAVDVTSAFCHRASIAHQLTNCLTEVFFEDALKQAQALDEYQRQHGDVKGPFHGLPISLKDNLNVAGQATSIGIVNFCFNPEKMEQESEIVKLLRNAGAVFYVKTNVPVAMMMPETTNHIYGNTTNPLNRNLSSGGSSGGEVALIALKGSPIGIGSDIGGSLRIPASFTNLYTLKPTFGRFPTYGARSGLPGFESINSVNGPLSTNIDALEFYCKTIISQEPWNYDPKVNPFPWKDVVLDEKLTFAILDDDKVISPTPPIRRGMKLIRQALLDNGHEVIEWDPEDHLRLSNIVTDFFLSDGGVHVKTETEATGEPLFPYMKMYGTTPQMGVSDLWDLHAERTKIMKQYLDRWNETAKKTKSGKCIDGIIMPASPFAGNPNGKFHNYVGYTSPFNALDYAVGVFPVSRCDKDLDVKPERTEFYNDEDKKIWEDFDPQENHGGAIALQVVGRRFQDEKVVAMMKELTRIVNASEK